MLVRGVGEWLGMGAAAVSPPPAPQPLSDRDGRVRSLALRT